MAEEEKYGGLKQGTTAVKCVCVAVMWPKQARNARLRGAESQQLRLTTPTTNAAATKKRQQQQQQRRQ